MLEVKFFLTVGQFAIITVFNLSQFVSTCHPQSEWSIFEQGPRTAVILVLIMIFYLKCRSFENSLLEPLKLSLEEGMECHCQNALLLDLKLKQTFSLVF